MEERGDEGERRRGEVRGEERGEGVCVCPGCQDEGRELT